MPRQLTAKQPWQIAEKRLKLIYLPPLPNTKERTQLLAALPEILAKEPVQDWLKRCRKKNSLSAAETLAATG